MIDQTAGLFQSLILAGRDMNKIKREKKENQLMYSDVLDYEYNPVRDFRSYDGYEQDGFRYGNYMTIESQKEKKIESIAIMLRFANEYYCGCNRRKDYKKAFYWYSKCANYGDVEGKRKIARMYYYGHGVEKNYDEAFKRYYELATQNDKKSQCSLGWLYRNGKGVEQNFVKAVEWFNKALDQGSICAAKYCGMMYFNGEGVEQNYAKALELYNYVLKVDDKEKDVLRSIGQMYYFGLGVDVDYDKAFGYYSQAAKCGDNGSMYAIGKMYYDGLGVKRNYNKAFDNYSKAALKGNIESNRKIAEMYLDGYGVKKNMQDALRNCIRWTFVLRRDYLSEYVDFDDLWNLVGFCGKHWDLGSKNDSFLDPTSDWSSVYWVTSDDSLLIPTHYYICIEKRAKLLKKYLGQLRSV